MAICKINLNEELNGIELLFDEKPSADTIASVKANGFRWSPKNKLWYAKNTADRLAFAESLGTVTDFTPTACAPSIEVYNLENLSDKTCLSASLHGADLAKAIREDLKKRGVKGCTVRAGKATYTTTITVTIKATADDLASIEEAAERFDRSKFLIHANSWNGLYFNNHWSSAAEVEQWTEEEKEQNYRIFLTEQIKKTDSFSIHHQDRNNDAWTLTTAFYNKCMAVYKIANQWNYDNSDSMTDYFDVGYYLDIDIKHDDFEPRATMTDQERAALAIERKEEERERQHKAYEEERKKAEEESRKYNEWVKESNEIILNDVSIDDLEEKEQLFAVDLLGAWGKQNSLEELREDVQSYYNDGEEPHHNNALITRIITFKTADAFDRFSKMFLHDFPFIEGKGGTATEDERINSSTDLYKLTKEQRESIDFYLNDCIAVYYDGSLQYVIDPQGYGYSRYVYLVDNCTLSPAPEKLEQMRKESENKAPFYFPAPVEDQINNIAVGDDITVWQCDGWLLNKVLDGFGTVTAIESGTYAQYSGVYIELKQGRKQRRVFIRDHKDCLIYKGLNVVLPEELTRRRINDHMSELYNYDVLLPNIYNYFKAQGVDPVIDTWQR